MINPKSLPFFHLTGSKASLWEARRATSGLTRLFMNRGGMSKIDTSQYVPWIRSSVVDEQLPALYYLLCAILF
jgi:hypothetical protein